MRAFGFTLRITPCYTSILGLTFKPTLGLWCSHSQWNLEFIVKYIHAFFWFMVYIRLIGVKNRDCYKVCPLQKWRREGIHV